MKKLLFFIILCISLGVRTEAWSSDYITGSGCSVSNVGYLTELAKEYERRTGVRVLVRGGGTVVGIEDLRNGKVDFAASCRSRDAGDPEDVQFIQVAWDALVFIVHKSNPAVNISLDEARAVYAGKITAWKQLKGDDVSIKIFISRAKRGLSGVEAATKLVVLKGKEPAATSNTFLVPSTAIVEQMVESTPEGFATTGFTSGRKRNVKMLKVNGVYPTKMNITNKKYGLMRPLFILIPAVPKPEVKKFVDFTLSKDGQNFIGSLGVVSLIDIKSRSPCRQR